MDGASEYHLKPRSLIFSNKKLETVWPPVEPLKSDMGAMAKDQLIDRLCVAVYRSHSLRILHRNIRLENFMWADEMAPLPTPPNANEFACRGNRCDGCPQCVPDLDASETQDDEDEDSESEDYEEKQCARRIASKRRAHARDFRTRQSASELTARYALSELESKESEEPKEKEHPKAERKIVLGGWSYAVFNPGNTTYKHIQDNKFDMPDWNVLSPELANLADDADVTYGFEYDMWCLGLVIFQIIYGVEFEDQIDVAEFKDELLDMWIAKRAFPDMPNASVYKILLRALLTTNAAKRASSYAVKNMIDGPKSDLFENDKQTMFDAGVRAKTHLAQTFPLFPDMYQVLSAYAEAPEDLFRILDGNEERVRENTRIREKLQSQVHVRCGWGDSQCKCYHCRNAGKCRYTQAHIEQRMVAIDPLPESTMRTPQTMVMRQLMIATQTVSKVSPSDVIANYAYLSGYILTPDIMPKNTDIHDVYNIIYDLADLRIRV